MKLSFEIKNYRCFPDSHPLRFSLGEGFTAFTGVNNAGKSSILRFFYEFRHLFQCAAIEQVVGAWLNGQIHSINVNALMDPLEVFSTLNNRDLTIRLRVEADSSRGATGRVVDQVEWTFKRNHHVTASFFCANTSLQDLVPGPFRIEAGRIFNNSASPPVAECSLIVEAAKHLSEAFYVGPFRHVLDMTSNKPYFDMMIGQPFIKAYKTYKTGSQSAFNTQVYTLTSNISRLLGFVQLEINPSSDDNTLQLFVEGQSFKLHEMGSGLAQLIVVLVNVAIKKPSFVFIDEPELNLHPSLQLRFLTAIATYTTTGRVVFATHNYGLARAAAENIYAVHTANRISEVQSLPALNNLSEFLGELSFSGYRDLGCDCLLLVEGVTDIKVFQQFLRLYKKDQKVVILPLNGSEKINGRVADQLEEMKRITPEVYAIVDSERQSSTDPLAATRKDFEMVCVKAGVTCHVLEYRAIENYLTDTAIKRVKGDGCSRLGPYDILRDMPHGWSKSDNWRIAAEMTKSDIADTDLGKFLDELP